MAKLLFSFALLLHGLIHLIGFVKAYKLAPIEQLSKDISKPVGLIWLACALLFIIAIVLYLSHHSYWAFIALTAVLISQLVIILSWGDAKFGTLANMIILAVALPAIGSYFFKKMVHAEQLTLMSHVYNVADKLITSEDLNHLPEVVKRWLIKSGAAGGEPASFVKLKQKGQMKTKADGSWMDFEAEQYVDIDRASFIWTTHVQMMPLISLSGRDKLIDGEGQMLIKLLSLIPVVNEGPNEKINTGSMLRYLGEMCWFPSGALNDYIKWQELSTNSAQATLTIDGISVQGIYHFDEEGRLSSFEAERYFGGDDEATLEKWVVENTSYKTFDGILIPCKSKVIWKLKEGDFHWLNLEIVDLEVNKRELYPN